MNNIRPIGKNSFFHKTLFCVVYLCFILTSWTSSLQAQFSVQWDKFYGGAGYDELQMIREVSDGYILMGSRGDDAPFVGGTSTTYGSTDYWIAKTDFDGNLIWEQIYGGFGNETLQDAIQTADGGFLLGGFSYSGASGVKTEASRGIRDMWVIKISATGTVEWDAAFGGNDEDYLKSITQTNDGGYMLAGWTRSTISGEVSDGPRGNLVVDPLDPLNSIYPWDCWAVRIDANGNILWDKRFGGNQEDLIQDVLEEADGSFIFVGQSRSDISGEKTEDAFGVIGSTGVKSLDAWVVKTNAAGNILWDRTFGGENSDAAHCIIPSADGNYLIGGYARSPMGGNKESETRGAQDYWLLKVTPQGTKLWDRSYGGNAKDLLFELKAFKKDQVALVGLSESDISGERLEPNIGGSDYWFLVVDQNGDMIYQKALGGTANDNMHDITQLSEDGSILAAGFTFSDTGGDITDISNGLQDGWLVKLGCEMYVDLGNDTLVCQGEPLVYIADNNTFVACEYRWNTGATTSFITVNPVVDTFYALTVTDIYGCFDIDTVFVTVKETPFFDLGTDYAICAGDTTTLSVGNTTADLIQWSTNESTPQIMVTNPGAYVATLTNANLCSATDAIVITNNALPDVDLGADQVICPDASTALSVNHPGPVFEWSSTGATSQAITVATEGEYSITVTDANNCAAADTMTLTHFVLPSMDLGIDTTLCNNETLQLDATSTPCFNCAYLWDNNTTNPIRQVQADWTQNYQVTVTDDNGCTLTDAILVGINTSPTISLGADTDICTGDSILITMTLTGTPPFTVIYTDENIDSTLTNINNGHSFWVQPSATTTYTIISVEDSSFPRTCMASTLDSQTITIYDHQETMIDVVLCQGESYFAANAEQYETGVFFDTLATSHNCDSVIVTNLTINRVDTTAFFFTTCDAAQAGADTLFLQNEFTCDSLVITTTDLLPSDTIRFFMTTCVANEAGFDTIFLQNQWLCDSLIVTETALLPSDTIQLSFTSCDALDVGIDSTLLINQHGCDSLVIATTVLVPTDTLQFSYQSCDINAVGIDTLFLTNQWGCDSLIIETTTHLPSDTVQVSFITCEQVFAGIDTLLLTNQWGCDSLVIETTNFAESDTLRFNYTSCNPADVAADTLFLLNQLGCDSLIIETTTLLPSDTTIIGLTTCNPLEAGSDTLFLTNQWACDSLSITNTVLLPSDQIEFSFQSCTPSDAGRDSTLLVNQYGCDSLVIEITEWTPSDTIYISNESCDPNIAGLDTLFLQNQYGCDSLQITETTLLPTDTTNLVESTCDQAAIPYEEILLANQYGCDSLITIERTIHPLDTTYLDATSCEPMDAGIDTLFASNQYGCDSLVITTTAFAEADSTFIEIYSCNPTEAGTIVDIYMTAECDSVVTTTTILRPSDTLFLEATTCLPEEVSLDTLFLQNQWACDSLVIVNTTLLPSDTTNLLLESCDPTVVGVDTLFLNNQYACDSLVITTTILLPTDTTYLMDGSCEPSLVGMDTLFLQNQYGCDSTAITTTIWWPTDTTMLQEATCDQTAIPYEEILLFNQYGCDSLITIERTIHPLDTTYLDATSCEPMDAGIDTLFASNQYGCDSLVITTTAFAEADSTFIELYSCDPAELGINTDIYTTDLCDSIVITTTLLMADDTTYLQSSSCDPMAVGVFETILSTVLGCDSLVIETVNFVESDEIFLTENVCMPADTGLVVEQYLNQAGCDSIVYIQSVLATDTLYIYDTSCNLEETGIFEETNSNQYGCDSIVLTTIDLLEDNIMVNTMITCDPTEVQSDTTFYVNSVGCDSIIIENVELLQINLELSIEAETCPNENNGIITVQSASGGDAPYLYAFEGGAYGSQTIFSNLSAGIYTINVQDVNGCEDTALVEIEAAQDFTVDLGEDVYLNLGESAAIGFESNQVVNTFTWSDTSNLVCPTCPTTMTTPWVTTNYGITATNENGCVATDQVLYIVQRERAVYIPSAFSPNGDNINDTFLAFTGPSVLHIHSMLIVDRWGEKIYAANSTNSATSKMTWDGTFRGKPLNPAVFIYQFEVEYIDGRREMFVGDVTLMR